MMCCINIFLSVEIHPWPSSMRINRFLSVDLSCSVGYHAIHY
jgi:hypothetical protein